jgi:non-specific serine/threonine protein kinase
MAEAFKDLGRTALLGGDADRAIEMLRVAIPIYRDLNDRLCIALCFHDLAGARTRQGTRAVGVDSPGHATTGQDRRRGAASILAASILKEAARLFAAAETLREATGIILHPWYRPAYERDRAILRKRLGGDTLAQAWAEGRAMSLEQAADYALAITEPPGPELAAAEAVLPHPAPAPTPEPASGRLSPREQEVAALVARGLTNRQIGERLTLSERTVDTHVRNILGKLELVSRAQIAAWAVEHRLRSSQPARAATGKHLS